MALLVVVAYWKVGSASRLNGTSSAVVATAIGSDSESRSESQSTGQSDETGLSSAEPPGASNA